jgi:hypothetical protein
MWLVDPRTKEPLPALDSERRFLERLRQRSMEPRWVVEYENGVPVRMRWHDPNPPPLPPSVSR